MTKVDTILTGGSVATMNDDFALFIPGAVAIRDGIIEHVGPADQVAAAYTSDGPWSKSLCGLVSAGWARNWPAPR
jgi:predicted amidohydrolase YtcJ